MGLGALELGEIGKQQRDVWWPGRKGLWRRGPRGRSREAGRACDSVPGWGTLSECSCDQVGALGREGLPGRRLVPL